MPESETSPFPLIVIKFIPPFLSLPISQAKLSEESELYAQGSFFVADLLLRPNGLPSPAQIELDVRMEELGWDYDDLPTHPFLIEKLKYDDVSPQLADAIKARLLQSMADEVTDCNHFGRPSFLALVLLPDLPEELMTSTLWDEFQDLLALRELRPKMKFEEIFEYKPAVEEAKTPPQQRSLEEKLAGLIPAIKPGAAEAARAAADAAELEESNLYEQTARGHNHFKEKVAPTPLNDSQRRLLTFSIHVLEDMGLESLGEECVRWVNSLNYPWPSMIHALCSLLAVRPEELVNWFTKHAIPIEPLSYNDLKQISEDARG